MKKEKKTSESKLLTNARWDRINTKSFTIKCYIKSDTDILEKLETVSNRNGYIKALIRADIDGRVLPDPDALPDPENAD